MAAVSLHCLPGSSIGSRPGAVGANQAISRFVDVRCHTRFSTSPSAQSHFSYLNLHSSFDPNTISSILGYPFTTAYFFGPISPGKFHNRVTTAADPFPGEVLKNTARYRLSDVTVGHHPYFGIVTASLHLLGLPGELRPWNCILHKVSRTRTPHLISPAILFLKIR